MVPRAVLMKSGLVSVNTARQVNAAHSKTTMNDARPMSYLSKTAHTTVKRPINKNTTFKNNNINQRVNTVRGQSTNGLHDQGVIDSGCSRHMTRNMSYLKNYEEIDGGYVAFGGNLKGGKITGKDTIKTDHLGKFDGKADEGFFVGYSLNSKAFRVFNSRTRIVEENLHIRFSESTPNVVGSRPDWLFDIDALTRTMNYEPIVAEPVKDYILLPLWTADPPYSQDPKSSHDDGSKPSSDDGKKVDEDPRKDIKRRKIIIFDFSRNDEDDGAEADMNNLDTTIQVSPIPTTRIHKDHPLDQVIRDLKFRLTQTRKMSKNLKEHGFVSSIQQRTNHKDLQNCLFACFLSHEEPKKVIHALKDPRWIEAMQEELLQFKLQEVWTLADLPNRKGLLALKLGFQETKG
ncbi:putative ribonuclease H-like domain-containing protein [Tanacetum coccineum]